MSDILSRKNRPETCATGANFRASEGDERRGFGQARGAKKASPVIPEYEKVDDLDRVFFNNSLSG